MYQETVNSNSTMMMMMVVVVEMMERPSCIPIPNVAVKWSFSPHLMMYPVSIPPSAGTSFRADPEQHRSALRTSTRRQSSDIDPEEDPLELPEQPFFLPGLQYRVRLKPGRTEACPQFTATGKTSLPDPAVDHSVVTTLRKCVMHKQPIW